MSLSQVKKEILEADAYIPIHIEWELAPGWNSRTYFWMIGDRNNSLLEVGLDAESGIITSVTLVAVDAITEIEELPLLVESIQVEGLPTFDIEGWSEDGYEIEKAEFKIFKGTDRLLIFLTEEFHPSLKITNDRVSFGFDAQHNLILIEIANLKPFEMEEVLFNFSQ